MCCLPVYICELPFISMSLNRAITKIMMTRIYFEEEQSKRGNKSRLHRIVGSFKIAMTITPTIGGLEMMRGTRNAYRETIKLL